MYGDSSEVKCFKARKFAWNQYHPISQYVSLQFSRSKVWFWAVIELQEVRTLPGHDGHVQLWLSYRHSGRRTMTFHPQQEAYTKNDQLILYQLYTSFSSFSLGMILIKKKMTLRTIFALSKKNYLRAQFLSSFKTHQTWYEYSVTCLTCCLVVPSLLQLGLL